MALFKTFGVQKDDISYLSVNVLEHDNMQKGSFQAPYTRVVSYSGFLRIFTPSKRTNDIPTQPKI